MFCAVNSEMTILIARATPLAMTLHVESSPHRPQSTESAAEAEILDVFCQRRHRVISKAM